MMTALLEYLDFLQIQIESMAVVLSRAGAYSNW